MPIFLKLAKRILALVAPTATAHIPGGYWKLEHVLKLSLDLMYVIRKAIINIRLVSCLWRELSDAQTTYKKTSNNIMLCKSSIAKPTSCNRSKIYRHSSISFFLSLSFCYFFDFQPLNSLIPYNFSPLAISRSFFFNIFIYTSIYCDRQNIQG